MHEENGLAKRGWQIIMCMKNSMLIDSRLLNAFLAKAMETVNYLQNRLPTQSTHDKMILKETWRGQ